MYKTFVSFDYEDDKRYKFLMQAWDRNPLFEFSFKDMSSQEINSYNIAIIKANLTKKIKEASHTLVIVGRNANKLHEDHALIGFRNWINFEVYQSIIYGNRLVAIKLDRLHKSPEELLNASASWVHSFDPTSIMNAIRDAR